MEQGRIFLAIVLSLVIFLVWDFFFVDREALQQKKPVEQKEVTAIPPPQSAPTTPTAEPPKSLPVVENNPLQPAVAEPPKTITVETPLYIAELSEKGGNITGFTLKHYRESVESDAPFKQLISENNPLGTIRFNLAGKNESGIDAAIYKTDTATGEIKVSERAETITFTRQSADGIIIEKIYLFSPDTYLIDFDVILKNQNNHPISEQPSLSLVKFDDNQDTGYGFTGPSGFINGKLKQIKKKKIAEQNEFTGNIGWVAIQDRYFITAIVPKIRENYTMRLSIEDSALIHSQLVAPTTTINPTAQQKFGYQLFFGPKSLRLLRQFDNDLHKAIYFGWFDILAKPCLWVMNFIYDHIVANYGIAIILLTLLTKLILWPLGQKSYKSMAEMKKIQPLMTEIREKYKHDKKKMNEEVMALYRAYKVNPMGGCLPMVVQIPVFIALYRMLYEAIELRHTPFFGWINDLSAPDRLFDFGFSIPFMQPPYGIPVLTLVMGATMFLQQKLQPAMGDPTQAKLMMLMPIFFTFIFINFPSGLVLYWLVNNVFSIAQQYLTHGKKK